VLGVVELGLGENQVKERSDLRKRQLGIKGARGLGIDYQPAVDFAVRCLQVDGLRLGAFQRHKEGSNEFSNRGLDAPLWLSWVAALAQQFQRIEMEGLDGPRPADVRGTGNGHGGSDAFTRARCGSLAGVLRFDRESALVASAEQHR
jgi:hypothetical protein